MHNLSSISPVILIWKCIMELYTSFLVIIFFIFLFNLLKKSSTKNLPPGPFKLPFIGNLLQVAGKIPHRGLRDLANIHGPIMHLKLGEIPTVIISSSRVAKEVLKTNDLALADRPNLILGQIILANCRDLIASDYCDYWRQMRKLCTVELLSSKKVKSFHSIREDETSRLMDLVRNSTGSLVNISHMLTEMSNSVVCRAVTGKRYEEDLAKFAEQVTYWGGGFLFPDLFPSLKFIHALSGIRSAIQKLRKEMDRIFGKIIEEHREKSARRKESNTTNDAQEEDLIDVLLRVNESGRLELPITSNDIKGIMLDMFNAGTDPISAVLEWTITELMKNPRVMKKLQTEIRQVLNGKETISEADIQGLSYLKMVIKEAVRLHPPLPLSVPRECREECEIDGYIIPVKTKVIINVWAIGRDPEYWIDAESFNPERFENTSIDFMGNNYNLLPFGSGRRMCPGINFGMATVELPLAQLLYHFDWKLPNNMKPENMDMEEASGSTVKKKNNLFLIPTSVYTPTIKA